MEFVHELDLDQLPFLGLTPRHPTVPPPFLFPSRHTGGGQRRGTRRPAAGSAPPTDWPGGIALAPRRSPEGWNAGLRGDPPMVATAITTRRCSGRSQTGTDQQTPPTAASPLTLPPRLPRNEPKPGLPSAHRETALSARRRAEGGRRRRQGCCCEVFGSETDQMDL